MNEYTIKVQELDDGPLDLRRPIPDSWLRHALEGTEVAPAGADDGVCDVSLTKSGREVLVRGKLAVTVQVPCSRTLDPAVYQLRPEVFLLLAPAGSSRSAEPSGASEHSKRGGRHARSPSAEAPAGRDAKKSKKEGSWENDPLLSEEEAAEDVYVGDQVVLDDFFRQFILLEVPMVPLREDLRGVPFEANPPPPSDSSDSVDPRLSPLAELKARLERKKD